MQKGLISVIVPIYKSESFLEACVDSILQQTYPNLEIILVNDGSPDYSGDICDTYSDKDSRIKVIHKSNGGVSSARNAGLDIATGEFIAFVDSDDTLEQNMYEFMYDQITGSNSDICICGFNTFSDISVSDASVPQQDIYSTKTLLNTWLNDYLYYDPLFLPWNKLIRSNLIRGGIDGSSVKPIRFPEGVRGEDSWFVVDCLAVKAPKPPIITTFDMPLYNYMAVNNPDSICSSFSFTSLDKWFEHLQYTMESILPEQSRDTERAIWYQKSLHVVRTIHSAIASRQKVDYKLTWSMVKAVSQNSPRRDYRLSALFMFFLPQQIYRLIHQQYRKSKARTMRSSVGS